MKTSIVSTVLSVLLATTAAVAAPFVAVDGRVLVDGVGLDEVVDVTIEIRDDDGEQRISVTEAAVIVVDGSFAIDLDIATIATDLARGATMTVEVTVDDLTSTTIIGRVYGAHEAAVADVATTATTATSLGTIDGASLIAANAIATAGGVRVAFENLTGVPGGIADGVDNGTIDGVGTGLEVSGGTLRLTTVTSAQIVDGSVPSAALGALTFTGTQLTGLQPADVAAATLTGANFATSMVTTASDISGTKRALFIRDFACEPLANETSERVTVTSSCTRRICSDGRIQCGTVNECVPGGIASCTHVRLGNVVFAP